MLYYFHFKELFMGIFDFLKKKKITEFSNTDDIKTESEEKNEPILPSKEEVMKELAEHNPYLKESIVLGQESIEETKDEDDWHKYYFRHHEDNIIEIVRKGYWEDKKIFYGEVKASRDEVLRAAESLMNIQILVGGNVCPFDQSEYIKLILNGNGFGYYQLLIGIDPDRQVYEDAKRYYESYKNEKSRSKSTHNTDKTKNHHSKFAPTSVGVKSRKMALN